MEHAARVSRLRHAPLRTIAIAAAVLYGIALVVYWLAGGGARYSEIKAPPWSSAQASALSGTAHGLTPPVPLGKHGSVWDAERFYEPAVGTSIVRAAGASGGRAISHTSAYNIGAFIRRVDPTLPYAQYAIWARVRVTNSSAPALMVGIIKRKTPFYSAATPLDSVQDERWTWFDLGTVPHDRQKELVQINAWLPATGSEGALLLDRVALIRVAPLAPK